MQFFHALHGVSVSLKREFDVGKRSCPKPACAFTFDGRRLVQGSPLLVGFALALFGGGPGVLYPGEIEHLREQDRRQNGVEVEEATWSKLRALAEHPGLTATLGL